MIRYVSSAQTKITEFDQYYELKLDPTNRWILLGNLLPWDEMVSAYCHGLSTNMGAGTVNPRYVIGALIIKHKLGLSDGETLQTIRENPYMQHFLGLDRFQGEKLFSPSLLCDARKRLGKESFDAFTAKLASLCRPQEETPEKDRGTLANQGKLKIDATVADQYVRYPNDLGILDEVRRNTERLVDRLFEVLRGCIPVKPRTYRKVAHRRYVAMAKKKKKRKEALRMEIRYQLNAVERNLGHIDRMLDRYGTAIPLDKGDLKRLWVAREVARQQRLMYRERSNRVDDRIVSPSQPHVRPIVRGKQGRAVEFGAKLGLSLFDGLMTVDNLSWDSYNECNDLTLQAKTYKAITGYWPELIQADKIYATNANRKWCAQRGIRLTATPKGRPKKLSAKEERELKKEYGERNQIEGRIGNAKQVLSLNQIKAKLKQTSESWIGAIIFTMNLSVLAKHAGFTF